ncbi:MFS general substrate transporter [Serendipita vermifera]|nr:MFS general substrate transporter [Serendipita vermifera]
MLISWAIKKIKARSNAQNDNNAALPSNQQDASLHRDDSSNTVANHEAHQDATTNPEPEKTTWEIWKPRLILTGAILLPAFLETLDYTVVATSQTNIASNFNRLDLQSYIGTAYVLGSTVFLPVVASLADIFGRYLAMQASVFIFLVGSAISTGASSMPALLLGRGIAGIGAAGLLGIIRIILSDSASLDDNNAQGSLMVLTYSFGYTLGPVLGGLLLNANWRWVFGINLPVCVASMIIMAISLPKITKGPQPPQRLTRLRLPPSKLAHIQSRYPPGIMTSLARIDIIGALIFIALGIAILLGLNWGSTEPAGWNQPKVVACLAVGGALIPVFVLWEYIVDHSTDHLVQSNSSSSDIESNEKKRAGSEKLGTRARFARLAPAFVRITDPMVPMNMFRSFDVIATNFATMTSGMVMLGLFYFVAIFYVLVNGNDAVHAGVQLLYFAPGIGLGVIISIQMIKRLRQPKPTIILATTILPIAIGFLGQALYTGNQKQIIGFLIMAGAGVGLGFGPLSYQARFSQPEDRVAVVVATNLFFRTAGGTIGLAQLSAVMFSRVRSYIFDQVLSGRISPMDAARIGASLNSVGHSGTGGSGSSGIFGLPDNLKNVATDAFKDGLRWAFLSLVPWLGVSFVLCLFLSRIADERLNRKPGQTYTEPHRPTPPADSAEQIVRIILSDSESLDDNNAQAGLMFIAYSLGYSLGPVLGGLLLYANWRWVFGINLPVCAASIVIMALLLPKILKGPQPSQRHTRLHLPPSELAAIQAKYPPSFTTSLQRIDSIGAVIFIIMGAAILLGLNWGSTDPKGWNQAKVIATLVVGGAVLPVFILWEYIVDHSTDHLVQPPHDDTESALPEKEKGKGVEVNQPMVSGIRARIARLAPEFARITEPIVPMNMFRSYDVVATNYATLTSGMATLGIFYFVAIFFVIVSGKDAVKAGVQLLYFVPGIGVGALISMALLKRIRQPRSTIIFASLVLPIAVGLLSQALYEDKELQITGFMITAAGGIGIGFGPLSIQARFCQPEDRVAIVVATNLFFRTAGGIIGIAQLSAVMFSRVRSYITAQVYNGRISPFDALRIASSLNSVGSKPHGPGGGRGNEGNRTGIFDLPENLKNVTIEAFKDGLRWAFLSLVPWLAVAFIMTLFLNKIDEERMKVTGDKDQHALPPVEEKAEPKPTNNPSEQATKREEETVV